MKELSKIFNIGFIIGGLIAVALTVNILFTGDKPIYPLLIVPIFIWVAFTYIGYQQIAD